MVFSSMYRVIAPVGQFLERELRGEVIQFTESGVKRTLGPSLASQTREVAVVSGRTIGGTFGAGRDLIGGILRTIDNVRSFIYRWS
jgi:hypothetical protein